MKKEITTSVERLQKINKNILRGFKGVDMNKKQIWALCVTIGLVCAVFLATPRQKIMYGPDGRKFEASKDKTYKDSAIPTTDWGLILQISIPVLLIGGTVIYILKDKERG